MTELPRFESYGNARSNNYGLNSLVFYTSEGTFWFSYQTLVAFKRLNGALVCRENDWGPTTGKHLNLVQPNHSCRVPVGQFRRLYDEAFGGQG